MNKIMKCAALVTLTLLLGVTFAAAAASTSPVFPPPPATCTGGASLSGWYGFLVNGPSSVSGQGGKYLTGAIDFNGACSLSGFNTNGGVDGQFANASVSGTYNTNADGTIAITLNLTGQSTAQTYTVAVSQSGIEADGIETDGTATATIDLKSQMTNLTQGYTTASLVGTYAGFCSGNPGPYAQTNYVTFDGNGNLSGVDYYNDLGSQGNDTFAGTYTVASDGTFTAITASTVFFTGVLDTGTSEAQYTFDVSGTGEILSCVSKLSTLENLSALNGWYSLLVSGPSATVGAAGKYLSGSLLFNGAGAVSGTNVNGGINGQYVNSTVTGTYALNGDGTIAITLNLAGQSTAQTYNVSISETGNEAVGIETDGTALAQIDLQAELWPNPAIQPYTTASLVGTYAAACSGDPGSYSELNYVTFDGKGNLSGINAFDNNGSQGDGAYTGTYSVKGDGTFSGALAGSSSQYSFTGALSNVTSEIVYTYDLAGTGGVIACTGYSNYGPIGSAPVAATPTFNPLPGAYTAAQLVVLSDTTTGAVIHYTTNGTAPTTASPIYATPVPVNATTSIQAIAVAPGDNNSAIASGTYFLALLPTAVTPTFNPLPGTYSSTQTVVLSDTTPGAVIHCTTDGSMAGANSPVCTSLSVSATTTINAIAVATGYNNSPQASGLYTISTITLTAATPMFNPLPGTYSSTQTVVLSDSTSGAVIHCTIDGSAAGPNSPVCTTLTVSTTTTINAIAVAAGYNNSPQTSGLYTITTGGSGGTIVNLAGYDNVYGIATSGNAPRSGGFDGDGYAYNSSLLGSSLSYQGLVFPLGSANTLDAVVAQNVYVTQGQYSQLFLLGAGVNGNQTNQYVVAYYTDGSWTAFTQNFSDWAFPQKYAGETEVAATANRIGANGTVYTTPVNVYGYTFNLAPGKTLKGVLLPYNRNVVFLGMGLTALSTPIVPYIQVNGAAWQQTASASVTAGSVVNLGPQPVSGGSWSWTGPNGYTSTSRQINSIPLTTGVNNFVATYTNSSGAKSTQTFVITVTSTSTWTEIGTNVSSIAAASDGTTLATSSVNQSIWQYVSGKWTQIPGAAKQIAVVNKSNIWGIGLDNNLYQFNGNNWTEVGYNVNSVGVGSDGSVVVTTIGNQAVWEYVSGKWILLPGQLKQVAVVNKSNIWGIGLDNNVYQFNGSVWTKVGVNVDAIAAGSDGTVLVANNANQSIWQYVSVNNWVSVPGSMKALAIVKANSYYGIGLDNNAYSFGSH
jgi:hypothetical protein